MTPIPCLHSTWGGGGGGGGGGGAAPLDNPPSCLEGFHTGYVNYSLVSPFHLVYSIFFV